MSTYNNVKLGITHENGELTITKGKLEWREKSPGSKTIAIDASEIKTIEWLNIDRKKKLMRITFTNKAKEWIRFIGFANDDEVEFNNICKKNLGKGLNPKMVNLSGQSWGKFVLRGQDMVCRTENKHIIFTVPYNAISQSVIQARNEISLEFKHKPGSNSNNNNGNTNSSPVKSKPGSDQLVEMRIFIPDDEEGAAYQEFHQTLMKKAKLEQDKSQIIAWFQNVLFRVPRGNKEIFFYPDHFLFRTDTFAYRIKYKQIKRLFFFEQPGDKVAFLVSLSPGIRQGYQTYGYLIMEFPREEQTKVEIKLTEEQMQNEYTTRDGKVVLERWMHGETHEIISRVFMALSKVKIIAARKFESSDGEKCVSCSLGASQGLLYPLEKSIFFIWKPVSYIRHTDIENVDVLRMEHQSKGLKEFDLQLKLKKQQAPLVFTGIDRSDFDPLMRYFLSKPNINILDRAKCESMLKGNLSASSRSTRTRKNIRASSNNADVVLPGAGGNDDDDDEEDEDYDMDEDRAMLEEDDEQDDNHFDKITEPMNLSGEEDGDGDEDGGDAAGSRSNSNSNSSSPSKDKKKDKKKKKKHHKKERRKSDKSEKSNDSMMVASDEDDDL